MATSGLLCPSPGQACCGPSSFLRALLPALALAPASFPESPQCTPIPIPSIVAVLPECKVTGGQGFPEESSPGPLRELELKGMNCVLTIDQLGSCFLS